MFKKLSLRMQLFFQGLGHFEAKLLAETNEAEAKAAIDVLNPRDYRHSLEKVFSEHPVTEIALYACANLSSESDQTSSIKAISSMERLREMLLVAGGVEGEQGLQALLRREIEVREHKEAIRREIVAQKEEQERKDKQRVKDRATEAQTLSGDTLAQMDGGRARKNLEQIENLQRLSSFLAADLSKSNRKLVESRLGEIIDQLFDVSEVRRISNDEALAQVVRDYADWRIEYRVLDRMRSMAWDSQVSAKEVLRLVQDGWPAAQQLPIPKPPLPCKSFKLVNRGDYPENSKSGGWSLWGRYDQKHPVVDFDGAGPLHLLVISVNMTLHTWVIAELGAAVHGRVDTEDSNREYVSLVGTLLEELLSRGVSPDVQDMEGATALHYLDVFEKVSLTFDTNVQQQLLDVLVGLLVEFGADLTLMDEGGHGISEDLTAWYQSKADRAAQDRLNQAQRVEYAEEVLGKLWKSHGGTEFSFDEVLDLGLTVEDANQVLQILKDSGRAKTTRFRTFALSGPPN